MIKTFIIGLAMGIAFVSISVLIIQLPAFHSKFNLTNSYTFATALSGMTAPAIGLLSSILLFMALSEQTKATSQQAKSIQLQLEANEQQRDQARIELAHNLILQVEKNIESFFYTFTEGKHPNEQTVRLTGLEGLNRWCNSLKGLRNLDKGVGIFFQAPLLILIIRSISDLRIYLEQTEMTQQTKSQFLKKNNLLTSVIQDPLKK